MMMISSVAFALLFLIYSAISFTTFLVTTGGISALVELVLNPPLILINSTISLAGMVFRSRYTCPKKVFYSFVILILSLHVLCLAFNSGNTGYDTVDYAFYYETVLAGRPGVFGIESRFSRRFQVDLSSYLRLAYYGSIFVFLIYLVKVSPRRCRK